MGDGDKRHRIDRTEITAEVVQQAGRLALFGIDAVTIAARLGITEYVAGLLVRNAWLPPRLGHPRRSSRRVTNVQVGVGATTIRRIRRMLDVGERFLPEAVRCHGCGAQISVVRCRVCQHRTT